jgi:uncharacterized protein YnzC (UPF0291/DUF896 family)
MTHIERIQRIQRINELARKSRSEGLTHEDAEEQKILQYKQNSLETC